MFYVKISISACIFLQPAGLVCYVYFSSLEAAGLKNKAPLLPSKQDGSKAKGHCIFHFSGALYFERDQMCLWPGCQQRQYAQIKQGGGGGSPLSEGLGNQRTRQQRSNPTSLLGPVLGFWVSKNANVLTRATSYYKSLEQVVVETNLDKETSAVLLSIDLCSS